MRVLVACEFSGLVRDAFLNKGHDAMSCDLMASQSPGPHYMGDVREVLGACWDIIIAHPECTHLAVSGSGKFSEKWKDGRQAQATAFFMAMINAPAARIAVENPVCIMSTLYRKPDQIIQPWQFGHGETKATCLWLKGLPPLLPTRIVEGREERNHNISPGPDRWKTRSVTYPGIAAAMADQWGKAA